MKKNPSPISRRRNIYSNVIVTNVIGFWWHKLRQMLWLVLILSDQLITTSWLIICANAGFDTIVQPNVRLFLDIQYLLRFLSYIEVHGEQFLCISLWLNITRMKSEHYFICSIGRSQIDRTHKLVICELTDHHTVLF